MRVFRQGQGHQENTRLRGDVASHVAQVIPQIDAEIGEIDHLWMETSWRSLLDGPVFAVFLIPCPHPTADGVRARKDQALAGNSRKPGRPSADQAGTNTRVNASTTVSSAALLLIFFALGSLGRILANQ